MRAISGLARVNENLSLASYDVKKRGRKKASEAKKGELVGIKNFKGLEVIGWKNGQFAYDDDHFSKAKGERRQKN